MQNKLLPGWDNRTVKYYYLSEAAIALWFIAPVWFFVFRNFVSVQEIGINEIIAFTVGFMAEVPSGALADSIGRRKTLILGGILLVIGAAATAFAFNLLSLVIAQSIWFIGFAFYSGANDALVYDKLIADRREADWPQISARKNSMVVLVTLVSVLIGGFLYMAHFRLPFIAHTFAMVAFLFCVLRYPKDENLKVINKSIHSVSKYGKTLRDGARGLLVPKLRFLLWGVLAFTAIYHAYEFGVLRPLILSNRGYDGFSASVLSFILHIGLFALFLVLPRIFGKTVGERKLLVAVIFGSASYLLFALDANLWLVGLVAILFTLMAEAIQWWTSIYINQQVGSTHRATILSTWAMLQKVPYILLVGTITNISGYAFSMFIIVSGAVVGLFALLTLLLLRKIDPTVSS